MRKRIVPQGEIISAQICKPRIADHRVNLISVETTVVKEGSVGLRATPEDIPVHVEVLPIDAVFGDVLGTKHIVRPDKEIPAHRAVGCSGHRNERLFTPVDDNVFSIRLWVSLSLKPFPKMMFSLIIVPC